MTRFTCALCGQEHDGPCLDVGYDSPGRVARIAEGERESRVRFNGDLCVLDKQEFFIRGALGVPIRDTDQEFRWGVWVRVDERDFRCYTRFSEHEPDADASPFTGFLAN